MEEQKQKCIKCGTPISQGEEIQTKKGTVCLKCVQRRKRKFMIGIIAGCIVVTLAAFAIYHYCTSIESLEGIGEINDEILIENVEIKEFDVSKSIAVSSPTTVGGAIDDIELFKSKVQNIISSLNGNDLEMTIPSIAVFFGLDSFEISSSNYNLISEFANVYCQTNKEAVILVDGYTCDLGSDDYNNKLSKDRANIVKQVLVSRGVPAEKIILNYYGKSMYGKLDVSGREAHRRANISIK